MPKTQAFIRGSELKQLEEYRVIDHISPDAGRILLDWDMQTVQ